MCFMSMILSIPLNFFLPKQWENLLHFCGYQKYVISKIRLHLHVHLKEDILYFGPLVGVATETFECFNAIFRYCSIFSNHLAPSQDIAFQLASQEMLKHRLTGGWWPTGNGEWERPGPLSVNSFMLIQHSKLLWVGPVWNHLSMVILISAIYSSLLTRFSFQTGTTQVRCK